jgi:hypothetical protein
MAAPEILDEFNSAIVARVVAALRKAGDAQRKIAADGTAAAGEKFPGVTIRSPEAACAASMAALWDGIASEFEAEGCQ